MEVLGTLNPLLHYSITPKLQHFFALLLPNDQELIPTGRCVLRVLCARAGGFSLACGWLLSLIAKNVRTQRIPGYLEFVAIIKPEPDLGRIFARVL